MSIEQVQARPAAPHDGRALLLAALGLITLVSASGGFLGLVHRYQRTSAGY
jgi:hypothetical protein